MKTSIKILVFSLVGLFTTTNMVAQTVHFKTVKSYKWTEGWTTAEHFSIGQNHYMFLLKEKGKSKSGKNVVIHKINRDGSIGSIVDEATMHEGYTDVEFYKVRGKTFMMQIMKKGKATGGRNVYIRKVLSNGKIGRVVKSYKWSQGWSTIEFYTVKGKTYLYLAKEKGKGNSGKNTHIHPMKADGSIGKRIKEYTMGEGPVETEFYTIGKDTYLMHLMNQGYGNSGHNVFIRNMKTNGTFGSMVENKKWSEGWTNAEFFKLKYNPYLFLYKQNGQGTDGNNVHIHRMNSDGSIGSKEGTANWTSGWSTTEFYQIGTKTYMFQLKKKGKGKSGKNVHVKEVFFKKKKTKTSTNPNGKVKQDCLTFNPDNLEIRSDGDGYLLTDGVSRMMTFRTRRAANRALSTIINYGFNKRCFADRPNPGLSYFLTDNVLPKGQMSGEDCI